MPEKIAAAALRHAGKVYTGATHFEIIRKLIPQLDPQMVSAIALDAEDGFVTDTGRFVTRAEGFRIAKQAEQIAQPELADPDYNKQFYNTPQPSLDSGMIREYAVLRVAQARVDG